MIAVIDYGMGNIRSVQKGFEKVGFNAVITDKSATINNASHIVLPGVGSFQNCMRNLEERGLVEPILKGINKGKPFLGICLGLQLLFEESEEFGHCPGLGVIKGKVVRFQVSSSDGGTTNFKTTSWSNKEFYRPCTSILKVPHMGWNRIKKLKENPVLKDIDDGSFFYFVHSYYVVPTDDVSATTTEYGGIFTSSVYIDNIFACQFHPEKSQDDGLKILKSFGEWS